MNWDAAPPTVVVQGLTTYVVIFICWACFISLLLIVIALGVWRRRDR